LWEELKLDLNREKTRVIHLPTEKARSWDTSLRRPRPAFGDVTCGAKGRLTTWCRRSERTRAIESCSYRSGTSPRS
jgi:hypothetical protein